MKLIEYLNNIPTEAKTRRMLKLFDGLWKVHNYNINKTELYKTNPGYYLTKDLRDIEVNEEGLIDVNKLGNYSIGKIHSQYIDKNRIRLYGGLIVKYIGRTYIYILRQFFEKVNPLSA